MAATNKVLGMPDSDDTARRKASYRDGKRLYRRLFDGDLAHLAPVLAALQPLAKSSSKLLTDRLREAGIEVDEALVRAALTHHVRRPGYLERMAAPGSARHDLDGNPVEPVAEKHRDYAAAQRAQLEDGLVQVRKKARRRKERDALARSRSAPPPVVEVKLAGRRRRAAGTGAAGQGVQAGERDRRPTAGAGAPISGRLTLNRSQA